MLGSIRQRLKVNFVQRVKNTAANEKLSSNCSLKLWGCTGSRFIIEI